MYTTTFEVFGKRRSWKEKSKNDFKFLEEVAYFLDTAYPTTHSKEVEKFKINYDLYNGRADSADYSEFSSFYDPDDYDISYENIPHHDIISTIPKGMVGELRRRPFKPMAVDMSLSAITSRKKKKVELLKEYFEKTIIGPIREEVMAGMQGQQQSPDFMQQVEQQVQAMVPGEIKDFLARDYKSAEEVQAQKILKYLINEEDIHFKTVENFKHSLITGRQVYRIDIVRNKPTYEIVNNMGFSYGASANTLFIEDADWVRYEQNMRYIDLFQRLGDKFSEADIKKIEKYMLSRSGHPNEREGRMVAQVSSDPKRYLGSEGVNIRTKEGQQKMLGLYRYAGGSVLGEVRVVHFVFRLLQKMYEITEEVDGEIVKNVYSEHLGKTPGVINRKVIWVPKVFEVTKIGYGSDAVYVNKGPVTFQNRNLDDPFKVKLPYCGIEYSRLMGNTENVSLIDLGKPWQYKFNVQMARIEMVEATDLGKVMVMALNAKPKNWSWNKFLYFIKHGKLAIVDPLQEGAENLANLLKGVDLSNMQELAGKLNYLEFLKNQVALAMSYNPSRLGQISPYMTATNNQQNILQSSHQTEDVYSAHDKAVENSLNILLNAARVAYKNNPVKKALVLDDMSVTELNLDGQILDRSEIGVFVKNSTEEMAVLDEMKMLIQPIIQNQMGSLSDIIKIRLAQSTGELQQVAEAADARLQQQMQERTQQEREMQERQLAANEELLDTKMELERLKIMIGSDDKRYLADKEENKFLNTVDVNKNEINDKIEQAKMELAQEKELTDKQRVQDRELKMRELDIKEKQVKKSNSK